MSNFGRDYPAGTQNDPNAPWNQQDPPDVDLEDPTAGQDEECPVCWDVAYWESNDRFTGWSCGHCGWAQEAAAEDFNEEDQP
jgi:hypothetical protein